MRSRRIAPRPDDFVPHRTTQVGSTERLLRAVLIPLVAPFYIAWLIVRGFARMTVAIADRILAAARSLWRVAAAALRMLLLPFLAIARIAERLIHIVARAVMGIARALLAIGALLLRPFIALNRAVVWLLMCVAGALWHPVRAVIVTCFALLRFAARSIAAVLRAVVSVLLVPLRAVAIATATIGRLILAPFRLVAAIVIHIGRGVAAVLRAIGRMLAVPWHVLVTIAERVVGAFRLLGSSVALVATFVARATRWVWSMLERPLRFVGRFVAWVVLTPLRIVLDLLRALISIAVFIGRRLLVPSWRTAYRAAAPVGVIAGAVGRRLRASLLAARRTLRGSMHSVWRALPRRRRG